MSLLRQMAVKPETVKRFSVDGDAKKKQQANDERIERLENAVNKIKFRVDQLAKLVDALCDHRSQKVNPRDTSLDSIIDYVAIMFRVEREHIISRIRDHGDIDRARRLGMWLAKQAGNHTLGQIAKAFNRHDHATVSHAIRAVEKGDRALAKSMVDDFIAKNHHAEAKTTSGGNGATQEVQGMAGKDERSVSGTDGEREA